MYRVAREVARGGGDWASVPQCVREAVLLALTQPNSTTLSTPRRIRTPPPAAADASHLRSAPTSHPPRALPCLTEGLIESNIRTFHDAEWVREQAVRSFAHFHNSVEDLQREMGGHLQALWGAALQLHPEVLGELRWRFNLRRSDPIPDGLPIEESVAERLMRQEVALDQLVSDVQQLRAHSVQFAAEFLADEELRAMCINPAYLHPPGKRRPATTSDAAAAPERGKSDRSSRRHRSGPLQPPPEDQ